MTLRTRQPLVLSLLFLAVAVSEKLAVLHLPPDWLRGPLQLFGGAPAGFGLALLFFGWRRLSAISLRSHLSVKAAALHVSLLGILICLQIWFHQVAGTAALSRQGFRILAVVWTALIPLIVFTLVINFVPTRSLWRVARSLRGAWLYAAAVTAAVLLFRHVEDTAWSTRSTGLLGLVQEACFQQTNALLRLFYPVVIANTANHVLGTPRFSVEVSWLCSGIEGLLLVTVLIALWVFFFRKELVIRRALLVFPAALLLTWLANIVRLAVLIAIGDRGHGAVADVGFHAQAGWVSLNLITLGCLFLVQRHPWFRKDSSLSDDHGYPDGINYAVVYLLPFTLTLAVALFTQALAAGFEALYGLRLAVTLVALWLLRAHYRQMNWRFGPGAVLAGVAVAAMWTGIHLRFRVVSTDAIITSAHLLTLPKMWRWSWIGTRVFAAVLTVPIAEELAFRGFVARRVMRPDFENQPYREMNWTSLVVSSIVFGIMHGRMWFAGIVAGAVFWSVAKWKNRIGDAVVAHAVANGVIAIIAIHLRDYSMW